MTPPSTSKLSVRARLRIRGVGAAVLLAAACLGCSTPPEPAAPSKTGAPSAAIGGPTGRFVGSEACRTCHTQEFESWSASRHRTTLRPWSPGQPLRLATKQTAAPYRVAADGAVVGPGTDGKDISARVEFLVGGRHREDALVRLADGRLQVFPIAFDVDGGRTFEPLRELAGGTPPPVDVVDFWTRVGRNADLACYGCHATGHTLEEVGRSSAGMVLPGSKWVEPGVGCEGCHGPGGPHVDAAGRGKPDPATVKLGRGAGLAGIDACAACHGLRDVLPSPFGPSPAHRYGEPIVAAAEPQLSVGSNAEFRDPFFTDLRPATYQLEAIAFSQSGCAIKGGMTCAACHDVHSGSSTAALVAPDGGDALCASCHATVVAAGPKHTLHAAGTPGGRCLDCHMAPILRGPGRDAARDHSMAPPVAPKGQVPAACAACHAGDKHAAQIAAAWQKMPEGPAAKRRLALGAAVDAATRGAPDAAPALARLAADPDRGWFVRWALIQTLSTGREGPAPEEALVVLRRALTDGNPAIRRAAVRALSYRGGPSEVAVVQRATDDADPWVALESAHAMGQLGAPTAGARLLQLLKRPDLIADARAQFAYGHACLVGQDTPRAEAALRRALELNPMMVGAINDLGLALRGQGKRDEAIAAWTRALDLNPRHSGARQNLKRAMAEVSAAAK